jgi:hypothetical protein
MAYTARLSIGAPLRCQRSTGRWVSTCAVRRAHGRPWASLRLPLSVAQAVKSCPGRPWGSTCASCGALAAALSKFRGASVCKWSPAAMLNCCTLTRQHRSEACRLSYWTAVSVSAPSLGLSNAAGSAHVTSPRTLQRSQCTASLYALSNVGYISAKQVLAVRACGTSSRSRTQTSRTTTQASPF